MDRAFVSMIKVMNNIGEYLGYIILIIFSFGWIDTLWIFGIENSKEYTWWYLIHQVSNM
tara:strand:- start:1156 stop:1332 length:177 start_codon:yes stop_codon:yes gene_type:complete